MFWDFFSVAEGRPGKTELGNVAREPRIIKGETRGKIGIMSVLIFWIKE